MIAAPVVSAVEPDRLDRLERELKFLLPAARGEMARSVVAGLCRRDVEHPAATLFTIYFDTPDLRLLGEKIDSDYLKIKVRLRWYAPIGRADDGAHAFFEVKRRIGDRRHKVRIPTPYSAAVLRHLSFEDPLFEEIVALARPLGLGLPARLLPVLMLRYDRYRFVEPISSSRISVDTNIAAPRGFHRVVRDAPPVLLTHAVLEVKGTGTELPRVLHPLIRLGARRGSSSKYAAAAFAMLKYAS